jgi:flagellar assembly protein FliH
MQKYRDSEIKPFEFSDLQGTHVITQGDFKAFSYDELNGEVYNKEKVSDETLRNERTHEKKSNFKIEGVVRDSRGLARQEQNDLEKRIQEEVSRRLKSAYQDAYNEGVEKGKEEGRQAAFAEYQAELANRIEEFSQTIESLSGQNEKILEKNRQEIYEFIKRFTKWIVLKEINEQVYLESLLEKLILELNARKNLIVKVGRQNFAQMQEVIQVVEGRLGQLSNVRVEVVPEIHHPGIILESENGLIDGSIESVFQNIDKIFEQLQPIAGKA